MHNICIIFACKYETGAAHICRELVNFVEPLIDDLPTKIGIAQIANYEIICLAIGIFVTLQIYAADPETFVL